MSLQNSTGFFVSAAVHFLLLALLMVSGILPSGGCRTRQDELQIPIGFLVEEAPGDNSTPQPPEPPPDPGPEPEPDPEPDIPAPPPPKPEPQPPKKPDPPKKHEVKVNKTKVIRRDVPPPTTRKPVTPPGRKLTADDIRKMTSSPHVGVPGGSPTGSPTAQATEDNLAMARIKDTLDRAWSRPSGAEAAASSALLRLDFRADGSFTSSIARSSGNAMLDRSVLDAASGVRSFPFLPAGFVKRHPTIRIEFELTDF